MNYGEIAAFVAAIVGGVAGLMFLIFWGYMLVSYLIYACPEKAFGRREDYPMDSGIHKAQMGVPRAKEAQPK
jgi:hypothetical protein